MYMQHRYMVYDELHIHYYLFLNQNANDDAYSTPLSHEVWNMDNKFQLWEFLCVTIHFNLFLWNVSIILNMILSVCPFAFTGFFLYLHWSMTPFLIMLFRHMLLEVLSQTIIIVLGDSVHLHLETKCFWTI